MAIVKNSKRHELQFCEWPIVANTSLIKLTFCNNELLLKYHFFKARIVHSSYIAIICISLFQDLLNLAI